RGDDGRRKCDELPFPCHVAALLRCVIGRTMCPAPHGGTKGGSGWMPEVNGTATRGRATAIRFHPPRLRPGADGAAPSNRRSCRRSGLGGGAPWPRGGGGGG